MEEKKLSRFVSQKIVAGCDEAGRGALAGPVAAAAVILPEGFAHPLLNDSKQLTAKRREALRIIIEKKAIAWHVAFIDAATIDKHNILNASIMAMHQALNGLYVAPGLLLIDGNRFKPYRDIPHHCIVKGDGKYLSIAAASILAKTHRDAHMREQAGLYPQYGWDDNKGYPTPSHKQAINRFGPSPIHRLSYKTFSPQQTIDFSKTNSNPS